MTQFKKGNKYHTITEFAPVVAAALKAWPEYSKRPEWFYDEERGGHSCLIDIDDFPVELTRDVPDGSEVTPLTVDEIQERKREVWFIDPDTKAPDKLYWFLHKEYLITCGIPCYATKADCQRANGLEVE